jgi:hypothetical protein
VVAGESRGNNNAVIPSLENKNKDEDTLLNLETSNNALAAHYESPRLELPGPWELLGSYRPLPVGEREEA